MSAQPKISSRLSSLNMFGKFSSSSSKPPPPIEKDPWYQQGGSKSAVSLAPSHALSMHSSSVASMSVETLQMPQTPFTVAAARSQYDLSRTMSPVSTRSRTTTMTSSTTQSQTSEMSSLRRGISKLSSSFGKKSKLFLRSNTSRSTLSTESVRPSEDALASDGFEDQDVSRPWNFQHHLHVDEGLSGLPPEWLNKLRAEGFKENDVISIHSRRNRTTYLQNHPDVSPDVIRSRSRSPYSPSDSSTSPSSLYPLPVGAFPTRSTSLRRPTTGTSDNTSVSLSARSGDSSRSPDSTSPPSSYGFSSPCRPSVSSSSSCTPSMYIDGDDDYSDPGTATASQFGVCAQHTPVLSRGLPRIDDVDDDPETARTPPSRAATATFRVANPTPPSPPPAYVPSEPGSAQTEAFPRDEKHDPSLSSRSRDDRRVSGSELSLQVERRSEETLTPEVLLRSDANNVAPLGRMGRSDEALGSQNETPASPPPFKLHVPTDELSSTSPLTSATPRTFTLPPRLSLHQDDVSSWTASLFSALNTPDPELGSFIESSTSSTSPAPEPPVAKTTLSLKMKKAPVPLTLTHSSNEIPRVTIETDDDEIVESLTDSTDFGAGTSTPLFNEVLSLVKPGASTSPNSLSPVTSTYPYLPSPPPVASPGISSQSHTHSSPAHSPNQTYEFLKEHYDPQRNSSVSTSTGSRDSQATIATSRWSRATTVRDVRDATIAVAHVRKTSVANAMTVPAPVSTRHTPQQSTSTIWSAGSVSIDGSRPLSTASSDIGPCAFDFPLPPPSPGDVAFNASSVQPSPMSANFSTGSAEDVTLPYIVPDQTSIHRLSSPASTRSSQSSSGSRSGSSSSSSQVNPPSIRSGSDEGGEGHIANTCLNGAVHVELRYTESESEGSMLSPTVSTESELETTKWDAEQKKISSPSQIDITPRIFTPGADGHSDFDGDKLCRDRDAEIGDGASAVVDWLEEAPSPQYELQAMPLRDSGMLYNHFSEPSPRASLRPDAADRDGLRSPVVKRPSLQINGVTTLDVENHIEKPLPRLSTSSAGLSPSSSASATPSPSPSPLQRYRGWVSEVVAPLEEFIDHTVDPHNVFTDLQEIAEGESGSVFAATSIPLPPPKKKVQPPNIVAKERAGKVAVKQIPLLPGGSPKLEDLRKELMLMSRVTHANILSMDALYVDLVDDALWIEMELMERSLADILQLADEGLMLHEKVIARFTGDILSALAYLESLGIVHRDVRSDNVLVNSHGVLKLADFSHALLVDPAYPTYSDPAGVIYWQAPEMRFGTYDARKVDVWSAGATAWEMAEAVPPFMGMDITDPRQVPERWPALSQSDIYSRSFHDFLDLCSRPPSSRLSANDLLTTPFIHSAGARSLVVELLTQCKSIEERILRRQSTDSQGTVLS